MMLLVPKSSVSPSGAALATKVAPMLPVAPTLLSTITVRLRDAASLGASTRASTSVGPPAAKGTTMRMGLSCAKTGDVKLCTRQSKAAVNSLVMAFV